jgi:hypothetical protein
MPYGKKTGPDATVIGFNAVNKNKLLKPFVEPAFIQKSDLLGGQSFRERYFKIKPQTQIKAAPIESGEPRKAVNPSERCNPWLLYSAFPYGIKKVQFVCALATLLMGRAVPHIYTVKILTKPGRFIGWIPGSCGER